MLRDSPSNPHSPTPQGLGPQTPVGFLASKRQLQVIIGLNKGKQLQVLAKESKK